LDNNLIFSGKNKTSFGCDGKARNGILIGFQERGISVTLQDTKTLSTSALQYMPTDQLTYL